MGGIPGRIRCRFAEGGVAQVGEEPQRRKIVPAGSQFQGPRQHLLRGRDEASGCDATHNP